MLVRTKQIKKKDLRKNKCTKSKWDSERYELCYRLALLGLTEQEMANVLGISIKTFEYRKRVDQVFQDKLTQGRLVADSKVAEALYKKAIGYSHPDTHVVVYKGKVMKIPLTKYYPPDTGAAAFWLKNRTKSTEQPWVDAWRHDIKQTMSLDIHDKIDMSDFSDQELELLMSINKKTKVKITNNSENE